MNIGILGGSFDPPHRSHSAIVNACLKEKLVDQVWVCPSYNHSQKTNYETFDHRIKMCKLQMGGWFKPVKICDYEKRNRTGRTYSLMWMLEEKYPEHNFKIIIGEDCADNIKTWMNWALLIHEFSFIIFKRDDYYCHPESKLHWYENEPHKILKTEGCFYSSTYARKSIEYKRFNICRIMMSNKVVNYIINHRLYGGIDE